MDLRIQKTLESIEQEFFNLREKMPFNKIRINDLCKNAKINKSTFYRYYMDVFDLSDKLENKIIDQVIGDFTTMNSLFSNPEEFITGLLSSIMQHNEKILILFDGRMSVLIDKMEIKIKNHYLTSSYTPEENIMMSFIIGGTTHVFLNTKYDDEIYTKTIAILLRKILSVHF
ncbi:hypothetical protein [Lacrimispora sp.]|uniref:hypothetical protein n=1 Tax=Lacrimispora sp. TaxID=2719234 RepID=UPI0032E3DD33